MMTLAARAAAAIEQQRKTFMAPVKFVSGIRAGLRDFSPKRRVLDPALVAKAFSAKAAGSLRGLDMFAIRNAMEKKLRSTGGRPALQGTTEQAKIPKMIGG